MPEPLPKTLESYREAKSWFLQQMQDTYELAELESMFRYLVAEISPLAFNQVRVSLDHKPNADFSEQLWEITKRLQDGEPLQYIVNKAYFCDLDLVLEKGVLIPRPETEELVYRVLEVLGSDFKGSIVDIGTGSGCIALALQYMQPQATLMGIDKSEAAIAVAEKNAARLELPVVFENIAVEDFRLEGTDVVVSNPPYIGRDEAATMEKHVTDFEPDGALFVSETDPLYFYRIIAEKTATALAVKHVFLEINPKYAAETIALFQGIFKVVEIHTDINGKKRMVHAQR